MVGATDISSTDNRAPLAAPHNIPAFRSGRWHVLFLPLALWTLNCFRSIDLSRSIWVPDVGRQHCWEGLTVRSLSPIVWKFHWDSPHKRRQIVTHLAQVSTRISLPYWRDSVWLILLLKAFISLKLLAWVFQASHVMWIPAPNTSKCGLAVRNSQRSVIASSRANVENRLGHFFFYFTGWVQALSLVPHVRTLGLGRFPRIRIDSTLHLLGMLPAFLSLLSTQELLYFPGSSVMHQNYAFFFNLVL